MSWTAPRTWVVGEVLTAGLLNAHVRDNLLETAPAVATAVGLPYADAANSLALLAAVGNGGKYIRFNAGATAIEAADAGGGMNWAIEQTGDPAFPHNGDTTTDVTISGTTTWTEANYPGRVAKIDVLTINAGIVLTLQGGPFFIFCETLAFGDTASVIDGNGPAPATPTTTVSADYARGGLDNSTGAARGGAGGIMIFICATETTTAAGVVRASGGNGIRNTTNNDGNEAKGGQGARSITYNAGGSSASASLSTYPERWSGITSANTHEQAGPDLLHLLLGRGGENLRGGRGGGSGNGENASVQSGGGSGIGGGGGYGEAGEKPLIDQPSILNLLFLAQIGCLGGGGGSAGLNTTGTNNYANGGGGGSVVAFVKTLTAAPTLTAAAGTGVGPGGGVEQPGAAGVTYLVDVPG